MALTDLDSPDLALPTPMMGFCMGPTRRHDRSCYLSISRVCIMAMMSSEDETDGSGLTLRLCPSKGIGPWHAAAFAFGMTRNAADNKCRARHSAIMLTLRTPGQQAYEHSCLELEKSFWSRLVASEHQASMIFTSRQRQRARFLGANMSVLEPRTE